MVFEHEGDPDRWIHALLPPLSLYIIRYNTQTIYSIITAFQFHNVRSVLVLVSVLEPNQTHTHISPCSMHNCIDDWSSSLFPVLCFLRGPVRFSYTHAIPALGEQSRFRGEAVVRDRRVSVISRTHPSENTPSS